MLGLKFDILGNNKTGMAFSSLKKNLKDLKGDVSGLGKKLGGLKSTLLVTFGGAALKAVADYGDHINDLSTKFQISTEVLSQYGYIADLSGTSLDDLATAIKKTGVNVSSAAQGSATQTAALKELGLSAQQLMSLPLDKQFEIIGDRIMGVTNQADKLRIGQALMGKGFSDLIPVFAEGASSLAELRDQADWLGITLSQGQASSIAEANDAWDTFLAEIRAVGKDIVSFLAPAFTNIMYVITQFINLIRIAIDIVFGLINAVYNLGKLLTGFSSLTDFSTRMKEIWSEVSGIKSVGDPEKQKAFNSQLKETTGLMKNVKGLSGGANKATQDIKGLPWKEGSKGSKSVDGFESSLLSATDKITDNWLDSLFKTENQFEKFGGSVMDTFKNIGKSFLKDVTGNISNTIQSGGGFSSIISNLGGMFGMGGGSKQNISGLPWLNGGGGGTSSGGGIGSLFSSAASGISSLFGGSSGGAGAGGGIMSSIMSNFGGFFADGGTLRPGQWGIAGEAGAEPIFAGNSSMNITPNSAVGGNVTVNMNINTPDVQNFRKSKGQLSAEMAGAIQQAKRNM